MRDYAKKRSWAVAVEVKDVGSGATTPYSPGPEWDFEQSLL